MGRSIRSGGVPVWAGGIAGVLVTLGFVAFHTMVISDISFMGAPMAVSGGICGCSLAWAHQGDAKRSDTRWWGLVGLSVALLVAMGGASFVVFEPEYSMGALMEMGDEALDLLLPRVTPMLLVASVVAAGIVWWWLGRSRRAVAPALVSQALLTYLVGHNLAFLGLVRAESDLLLFFVKFAAITAGIGFGFAAIAVSVHRVRRPASDPG